MTESPDVTANHLN